MSSSKYKEIQSNFKTKPAVVLETAFQSCNHQKTEPFALYGGFNVMQPIGYVTLTRQKDMPESHAGCDLWRMVHFFTFVMLCL